MNYYVLQDGSMLVYDVQNDIKINVDFEYKGVKLFSNIAFSQMMKSFYSSLWFRYKSKITTTQLL